MFGDQKHFDIRQTVTKENKENRPAKMINTTMGKLEQGNESLLKNNRSVLGLKTMNTIELSKSVKKTGSVKKLSLSKENVKPFALVG